VAPAPEPLPPCVCPSRAKPARTPPRPCLPPFPLPLPPPPRTLYLAISGIAALLFSAYLVYDLQAIMGGRHASYSPDEYVAASMAIYLDVIKCAGGGEGGRGVEGAGGSGAAPLLLGAGGRPWAQALRMAENQHRFWRAHPLHTRLLPAVPH
jgi:hypothetical protein